MYICISIYRDAYYVYVPGRARAHTHDCTQAQAPTTSSGSPDGAAAPAAMPSANAYRQTSTASSSFRGCAPTRTPNRATHARMRR